MKQVFVSGKGQVEVFDVPVPGRMRDSVLVRNAFSAISSGTEGASVSSKPGLLGMYEKARSSKDAMGKVWSLVQSQGCVKAWEAVQRKLADYSLMGYTSAGMVMEVDGDSVPFKPGDRVACMGAGLANHAEYVVVPKNLVAIAPASVPLEEASFGALGCIALQGIRRLELPPGERIGVLGLGLIGQICIRLAHALGYEAVGIDLSEKRAVMASSVPGIRAWPSDTQNSQARVLELTDGQGLDGVVVCAATSRDEPINLAFDLCRKRGRVSLVGDVGLGLKREKMYEKEIELRVSCSYGPGRYDPSYEMRGIDYPFAYVRWTERRNLEYFLYLLASSRMSLAPLVSDRFPVEKAQDAFATIKRANPDTYGVIFDYGPLPEPGEPFPKKERTIVHSIRGGVKQTGRIRLGLIGVGGHAKEVHLPNLKRLRKVFSLHGVASRSGASAGVEAEKHGATVATSDYRELLASGEIDAVLIATRHTSHARFVLESLDAGKHVFVEKPLALNVEDCQRVVEKASDKGLIVRVGFNRRFSPHLNALRKAVGQNGVRVFSMRINTGKMPGDWSNTSEEGGRVLGEAVHFFDLCNWFFDSEPVSLHATFAGEETYVDPSLAVQIRYPDGSLGNVLYSSLGDTKMGKEYFEALGNGRCARSDDFKSLECFGASEQVGWTHRGDKGHVRELEEFAAAIQGKAFPIRGADARAGLVATWMALAAYQSNRAEKPAFLDI
jgi:predicted dehydrogenase/threonine dehydrogenase-like Zn-dependent dehydrogenase